MAIKLFDSELKVMGVLWREGDCTAKHISDVLAQETGWKMNTTYTLIKRCIGKGAIERTEPNFMCHALIPKEQVQQDETRELIDKIYDGSADQLFAALLGSQKLSREQIQRLKELVESYEVKEQIQFRFLFKRKRVSSGQLIRTIQKNLPSGGFSFLERLVPAA